MSFVNSIAGNSSFSSVSNTDLSPSVIQSALVKGGSEALGVLEGKVDLGTVVGDFPVVDSNGVTVKIPSGCVPVRLIFEGDGVLETGGSVDVTVGASTTDGSAGSVSSSFQSSAYTPSAGVVGKVAPATNVDVGVTDPYLFLKVATAGFSVGGTLRVKVVYVM